MKVKIRVRKTGDILEADKIGSTYFVEPKLNPLFNSCFLKHQEVEELPTLPHKSPL